jgi:hypothetical protein
MYGNIKRLPKRAASFLTLLIKNYLMLTFLAVTPLSDVIASM